MKSPGPEEQQISSLISLWVQELTNQIERGVLSFLKGNLAVSKNQTNLDLQKEGKEIIILITIRLSFRLLQVSPRTSQKAGKSSKISISWEE